MPIEIISVVEKRRTQFIKAASQVCKRGQLAAALRKRRLFLQSFIAAIVITLGIGITFLVFSYISYSRIVDARLTNGYLTSRAGIYAAPRTLRAGQSLTRDRLIELLRRAGYLESNASDVWNGSFTAEENAVEIRPRQSAASTHVVHVGFDKKARISELTGDGVTLEAYTLEPEVLTNDSMKTGTRKALSYKEIPQTLVQAILSTEDRRFFEHRGVDFLGIGRAILRNVGDDEIGQGGSTITQQLVKNTYLSPERTFKRKFAEAMLAFTLERRLSKEDIFSLYCNEIYLGQRGSIGVRGVEQAAHVYFGKELKDLTLAESAMLAGMIQSPNRYAPDRHQDAATARRNTVIAAMLRDGVITKEQADAATVERLAVVPLKDEGDAVAPYFIDYVNRMVEARLASNDQADERGGVRVYTTIDLDLQQLAEAAVKKQLERLDKVYKNSDAKPQAALVALDPQTGDVLAMVGGRGYEESQLNRATDALRQPGSAFKPFVYAAALESGLSPVSMYADAPQEFLYDRHAKYRPANYGGGYSMRDVMMRDALVKSLNVVTVDVAMRTGLTRVARYAESFGLPKPQAYPALALGTTEATPLALASAYTVFANAGLRVEPNAIARMTDANDINLTNDATRARKVIDPTTAYMITDMLSDVIDHGTARAARGAAGRTAIAGKTGTSRDGWFIGYTPRLVVAVWIGFDDNKQLGLTGAEAALPAWTEFVKGAVELRPELGGGSFERPAGITSVEVDPESGQLATASCPQRERIAITAALAPNLECFIHQNSDAPVAALDEYSGPAAFTTDTSSAQVEISASLPRPLSKEELKQLASPPNTRVITDSRGRSVLVNEMSVRNHR
ncbi:MAG TPA: PBP1A family penicillin-binding protein [Pyrinomonadaceae bacterium]